MQILPFHTTYLLSPCWHLSMLMFMEFINFYMVNRALKFCTCTNTLQCIGGHSFVYLFNFGSKICIKFALN